MPPDTALIPYLRCMKRETLIDIIGFENRYAISNKGRIFSKKRNKFLSDGRNRKTNQYVTASLFKEDGIKIKVRIHNLVATHFIPNPKNKSEVNHKDFDKRNNCVSNLEWVTRKENQNHAYNAGRMVCPRNKQLSDSSILDIAKSKLPIKEIASKHGVNEVHVRNIKNGHRNSSVTGISPKEKNVVSKMSRDLVLAIFNENGTYREVAEKYNVPIWRVCSVKNGHKYAMITMGVKNKFQ